MSCINTIKHMRTPILLVLFSILKCSTLSRVLSSLCNTHIFVALPCPLQDPPYNNNSVPCPIPLPESCFFHCIPRSIYRTSCFWIILRRILLATGVSAMVWSVHPLTLKSVSTIKIMLSHPSNMSLSLNGPMDVKLCKSQEHSASPSAHGHSPTICNPRWSEHQDKALPLPWHGR
jgi:hypothetical protein